jgi:hypothetical protein
MENVTTGCIGGVAAHECDVGAVQGGDKGYVFAGLLKYLAGKVSCRGMRYGVVQVQYVELLVYDNVDHGAGQGGFVGGEVEQRISRHLYLVVINIGVEALLQAHGLLVGDEVNFIAFVGQGEAQLGSEHTATTESGVANDTYFDVWHNGYCKYLSMLQFTTNKGIGGSD